VLGYAVSEDGITWHKHNGPVLIPTKVPGNWDCTSLGDGCLLFVGADVYVYYAGIDQSWLTTGGLGILSP
jgi:predicted GH43/DUF377 family glycosyl hydrolase